MAIGRVNAALKKALFYPPPPKTLSTNGGGAGAEKADGVGLGLPSKSVANGGFYLLPPKMARVGNRVGHRVLRP